MAWKQRRQAHPVTRADCGQSNKFYLSTLVRCGPIRPQGGPNASLNHIFALSTQNTRLFQEIFAPSPTCPTVFPSDMSSSKCSSHRNTVFWRGHSSTMTTDSDFSMSRCILSLKSPTNITRPTCKHLQIISTSLKRLPSLSIGSQSLFSPRYEANDSPKYSVHLLHNVWRRLGPVLTLHYLRVSTQCCAEQLSIWPSCVPRESGHYKIFCRSKVTHHYAARGQKSGFQNLQCLLLENWQRALGLKLPRRLTTQKRDAFVMKWPTLNIKQWAFAPSATRQQWTMSILLHKYVLWGSQSLHLGFESFQTNSVF